MPQFPTPLLLPLLVLTTISIDCNFTLFEYFSSYSLGKQDELNRTFTAIQPLIRVPDVFYIQSPYTNYTLRGFNVSIRYLDSRQKAVIIGRDTVAIVGGRAEVELDFEWGKQTLVVPSRGTGRVRIATGEIMFEKLLRVDEGCLDY